MNLSIFALMKRFTSSVLYFLYIHENCVRAYRGEGGGSRPMRTHCVQGGEGGVKNWHIFAYVLYGWPLTWILVWNLSRHCPLCAQLYLYDTNISMQRIICIFASIIHNLHIKPNLSRRIYWIIRLKRTGK